MQQPNTLTTGGGGGVNNPPPGTTQQPRKNAWGQLEQLLTCAICLDRYRNPKLLPCQHTFCMEPCIEGLVDYIRKQIKCPECRAEHRIPYQGIQGYPTNVTLMRFLELHLEVTGELPDPTAMQIMERCGVCTEKAYCTTCSHCEKQCCAECKEAHVDIMRREIARINNQVRRSLQRLQDAVIQAGKSCTQTQLNCSSVSEEITEIYKRFTKEIKDRELNLKSEIDLFLQSEEKSLATLKENLEIELNNIQSNCDFVDAHINENEEWDDCELMDYKEVFLKTLDFLRNFDSDVADYRRVKFHAGTDHEILHQSMKNFGELTFAAPSQMNVSGPTMQTALARSRSDHRLITQFQKHTETDSSRSYLNVSSHLAGHNSDSESRESRATSPQNRRRQMEYGSDRRKTGNIESRGDFENQRYGDGKTWQKEQDAESSITSRFKSRFMREQEMSDAIDSHSVRPSRFQRLEQVHEQAHPKEKFFEQDVVHHGPLSGLIKLTDSAKVLERIHENETKQKKKVNMPAPPPIQTVQQAFQQPKRTQRQISEDDEISRIKAQNKQSQSSSSQQANAAVPESPTRPQARRVATLQKESGREDHSNKPQRQTSQEDGKKTSRSNSPSESVPPSLNRQLSDQSKKEKREHHRTDSVSSDRNDPALSDSLGEDKDSPKLAIARRRYYQRNQSDTRFDKVGAEKEPEPKPLGKSSKTSSNTSISHVDEDDGTKTRKQSISKTTVGPKKRSDSSSSSADSSSEGPSNKSDLKLKKGEEPAPIPTKNSFANKARQDSFSLEDSARPGMRSRTSSIDCTDDHQPKKFVSRFLNRTATKEVSSDSETDDDRETKTAPRLTDANSPTFNALLARSALVRKDSNLSSSRDKDDPPSANRSYYGRDRYGKEEDTYGAVTSKYLSRNRSMAEDESKDDKYGVNRYLPRSRSSAVLSIAEREKEREVSPDDARRKTGDRYQKESRYSALRRNRIGRSKSSHDLAPDEEDEEPEPSQSTLVGTYRNRYERAKTPETTVGNALAKSRSHHAISQSREASPEDSSSWARYLKNKYSTKPTGSAVGSSAYTGSSSNFSANSAMREKNEQGPLSHIRSSQQHTHHSQELSSDDSDDERGLPNSTELRQQHVYHSAGFSGLNSRVTENLRSIYLQKKKMLMKIGARGSTPGSFTWPRGIAIGPDNAIIVADSSNHRVQVFNAEGYFTKEFGTYGNQESEFDCLAGITVNRIGQYIISDRYNHRIQIFDPAGRFLRCFANQGTSDGKLNYPWGLATDSLGFIYVCDKENHRIQVFQSDGTFVGKFGLMGSKAGQLEHPHYIAVSNTNKVIISDSNNHRVQVFDVNGRVVFSFGTEGSDVGQFKFPRGIAVDDQGYIVVGDSGNNRIQIFAPDGTFVNAFGAWGSANGEFKGLEGVAVTANGYILVCDRENHRIQVF